MENNLSNYWNNCDHGLVQINISDNNKKILIDRFEKFVIPSLDLDDKNVIDYGVGGGYFAELIFNKFKIKKYIGIDISERSLKMASSYLGKNKNTTFMTVPDNFKDFNADIFFCFACIQHFVTEEYLINFLKKVNESEIPKVFLQIRHNKTPEFLGNLNGNVYFGCKIPYTYIENFLTNYVLVNKSGILKGNYQYLEFEMK